MAKKSKPTKAEQRSAAARKGWATRKAEARKRSDAARRGWETRKAAAKAASAKAGAKPTGSRGEPSPQKTPRGGGGGGGRSAPVAAPPPRTQPSYAPEFDELDDFYGGQDYEEEDEY